MKHDYEPMCGTTVSDAAEALVALAKEKGRAVTADFNEVVLTATPTTDAASILGHYDAETNKRRAEHEREHQAWLRTPAGQAAQRKEREREDYLEAETAAGLPAFDVADDVAWRKCVDANSDGYGACCVRYAARWANYMEKAMVAGATVIDCAKPCSRTADLEGITGFMYGAAVSMLAQCWRHGEELRRWHNLDTQIRDEGEKANEQGGTLNPALLSIG